MWFIRLGMQRIATIVPTNEEYRVYWFLDEINTPLFKTVPLAKAGVELKLREIGELFSSVKIED